MDDSIIKQLSLPVIGGQLRVFFTVSKYARDEFLQFDPSARKKWWADCQPDFERFLANNTELLDFDWCLEFSAPGPDARYNVGVTSVSSKNFLLFYEAIKSGLAKLKGLDSVSLDGIFTKTIGGSSIDFLEVFADNGNSCLRFWYSSRSKRFFRKVGIRDLEGIIERLTDLKLEASELMYQLEQIIAKD